MSCCIVTFSSVGYWVCTWNSLQYWHAFMCALHHLVFDIYIGLHICLAVAFYTWTVTQVLVHAWTLLVPVVLPHSSLVQLHRYPCALQCTPSCFHACWSSVFLLICECLWSLNLFSIWHPFWFADFLSFHTCASAGWCNCCCTVAIRVPFLFVFLSDKNRGWFHFELV